MKLKIIIPTVLIAGAAGVLAFETLKKDSYPSNKNELIVNMVGQVLEKWHYDPKQLDDSFSREVFHKYIDDLDGEKKFLLQPDVNYLSRYETAIDDEIRGTESLDFMQEADSILDIRLKYARTVYPEILQHAFDFTDNDSIVLSRAKTTFAGDTTALRQVWYTMLKYRTLTKLVELQDEKKQAVDTASIKEKSFSQLETEARAQVKRIYDLYFDRMDSHFTEKERFSAFMNAITASMDPHTDYFSPVDK